MINKMV